MTNFIYAQKSSTNSSIKTLTASNEDPHNPLVNGIPYSQYKAQVQAEKSKQVAEEAKVKLQQKAIMDTKLPIIKNDEKDQVKIEAKK